MKNTPQKTLIITIAVMLTAVSAQAATYSDTLGDTKFGNAKMDITQVELGNNATDLQFKVTLADGAAFATDEFARFGVGIDSVAGGDTTADAWNDKIIMSSGMDFWSGGYTDDGFGAGLNTYSAALGGWPEWQSGDNTWVEFTTPAFAGNDITFDISLANLGLSVGDTIAFDVYTFFNDNSASDALGLSTTMPDTGQYDSGTNVNSFTIVPEPASAAMILSMAAVFLTFAKRRF